MNTSSLNQLYKSLKNKKNNNIESIRDLTIIHLTDEYSLVIAVDSDGGIGPQDGDTVKCNPYDLGRFAMRVPLLELLSCGAIPVAAFDMLSLPMNHIGKEIVRGVRDELMMANLGEDFPLSGSTEDNVPTNMTSIGTTIIGMVNEREFTIGKTRKDDLVLCVGLPKSAPEDVIRLDDKEIVNQSDVQKIIKIDGVHEILPVGSKGIKNETQQLAETVSLNINFIDNQSINLEKSGGPSTCLLISCEAKSFPMITDILQIPVNKIAKLI